MPQFLNHTIENLRAIDARKRGYLTAEAYFSHINWVAANFKERYNKTFVYIDGEYKGIATNKTRLDQLIDTYLK